MAVKKDRLNVYFDPALSSELEALAARRKVSKSQIVEAALAAFLSPDGADHFAAMRDTSTATSRAVPGGAVRADE